GSNGESASDYSAEDSGYAAAPAAVVTVTAPDAVAGEPGSGQGEGVFRFSRSGPTGSGLTVNFTVGGTATSGSDYSSLGSSVTFAAGSATVDKTVTVLDDTLVEGDETVVVTLQPGVGYTVGSPSTATVTIKDDDGVPGVIYEADFGGGLPTGWTVVDGYSDGKTWRDDNPKGRSSTNWTGRFMICDSDWAGRVRMDEQLLMPVLNCAGYSGVKLKFSHYFRYYSGGGLEVGDVDVRVGGGGWGNVMRYSGGSFGGPVEVDLSGVADGQSSVQIRWRYYNASNDWYWGIDNVKVEGNPPAAVVTVTAPDATTGEPAERGASVKHGTPILLPDAVRGSGVRVWTSGDWSAEYCAANLVDRNTNTIWVGNANGAPWDITLDLGRVMDLTRPNLLFWNVPWTNLGVVGSENGLVWFAVPKDQDAGLRCRYLYFQLREDASRQTPPSVREIEWHKE
ncbi:MAG: Calx-beta domain-containing protein, partial [Kiritimatiellia bacterium]